MRFSVRMARISQPPGSVKLRLLLACSELMGRALRGFDFQGVNRASRRLDRIACWSLAALAVSSEACNRYKERSTLQRLDADTVRAEEACVDRWLESRGLDVFGSPEGTLYPGGSPTLDEKTGHLISRLEYVYAHHPEARRVCGSDR
jgi:hypothetical protein